MLWFFSRLHVCALPWQGTGSEGPPPAKLAAGPVPPAPSPIPMGKLCPHPVLGDARERLQMDREGGEKGSPRHSRTQSGGQTGRATVGKVPAVSRESPSSALPRPEQPRLGSTRNKHTCSLQARGEAAPLIPQTMHDTCSTSQKLPLLQKATSLQLSSKATGGSCRCY